MMVNTILLIVKQYIYATRCLSEQLSFSKMLQKIQMHKIMEEIIAERRNLSTKIKKKWLMYDMV